MTPFPSPPRTRLGACRAASTAPLTAALATLPVTERIGNKIFWQLQQGVTKKVGDTKTNTATEHNKDGERAYAHYVRVVCDSVSVRTHAHAKGKCTYIATYIHTYIVIRTYWGGVAR